jgi:hypothetical protein
MSSQEALLNSVRHSLNAIAQAVVQRDADPVPANPNLGYVLALGADLRSRAANVDAEDRRYVDGYWGQCHWNAAMSAVRKAGGVPTVGVNQAVQIVASPVRIFRGYANYSPSGVGNGWAEHSWCMEGNVLLETTGPMIAYFGAELNAQERLNLANGVAAHHPALGHGGLGCGLDHKGHRVPVDATLVADTVGLPSVPQPPHYEGEGQDNACDAHQVDGADADAHGRIPSQ